MDPATTAATFGLLPAVLWADGLQLGLEAVQGRKMRAKYFLTALLILSIALASGAKAAGQAEQAEGDWWNNLTSAQKTVFVAGFEDGTLYGYKLLDGALLMAHPSFNPEFAQRAADAEKMARRQLSRDFGSHSVGQIVVGLDMIYSDYRNTRIAINEAIIVALRTMDGTSSDEVAKLLDRKRKEAAN